MKLFLITIFAFALVYLVASAEYPRSYINFTVADSGKGKVDTTSRTRDVNTTPATWTKHQLDSLYMAIRTRAAKMIAGGRYRSTERLGSSTDARDSVYYFQDTTCIVWTIKLGLTVSDVDTIIVKDTCKRVFGIFTINEVNDTLTNMYIPVIGKYGIRVGEMGKSDTLIIAGFYYLGANLNAEDRVSGYTTPTAGWKRYGSDTLSSSPYSRSWGKLLFQDSTFIKILHYAIDSVGGSEYLTNRIKIRVDTAALRTWLADTTISPQTKVWFNTFLTSYITVQTVNPVQEQTVFGLGAVITTLLLNSDSTVKWSRYMDDTTSIAYRNRINTFTTQNYFTSLLGDSAYVLTVGSNGAMGKKPVTMFSPKIAAGANITLSGDVINGWTIAASGGAGGTGLQQLHGLQRQAISFKDSISSVMFNTNYADSTINIYLNIDSVIVYRRDTSGTFIIGKYVATADTNKVHAQKFAVLNDQNAALRDTSRTWRTYLNSLVGNEVFVDSTGALYTPKHKTDSLHFTAAERTKLADAQVVYKPDSIWIGGIKKPGVNVNAGIEVNVTKANDTLFTVAHKEDSLHFTSAERTKLSNSQVAYKIDSIWVGGSKKPGVNTNAGTEINVTQTDTLFTVAHKEDSLHFTSAERTKLSNAQVVYKPDSIWVGGVKKPGVNVGAGIEVNVTKTNDTLFTVAHKEDSLHFTAAERTKLSNAQVAYKIDSIWVGGVKKPGMNVNAGTEINVTKPNDTLFTVAHKEDSLHLSKTQLDILSHNDSVKTANDRSMAIHDSTTINATKERAFVIQAYDSTIRQFIVTTSTKFAVNPDSTMKWNNKSSTDTSGTKVWWWNGSNDSVRFTPTQKNQFAPNDSIKLVRDLASGIHDSTTINSTKERAFTIQAYDSTVRQFIVGASTKFSVNPDSTMKWNNKAAQDTSGNGDWWYKHLTDSLNLAFTTTTRKLKELPDSLNKRWIALTDSLNANVVRAESDPTTPNKIKDSLNIAFTVTSRKLKEIPDSLNVALTDTVRKIATAKITHAGVANETILKMRMGTPQWLSDSTGSSSTEPRDYVNETVASTMKIDSTGRLYSINVDTTWVVTKKTLTDSLNKERFKYWYFSIKCPLNAGDTNYVADHIKILSPNGMVDYNSADNYPVDYSTISPDTLYVDRVSIKHIQTFGANRKEADTTIWCSGINPIPSGQGISIVFFPALDGMAVQRIAIYKETPNSLGGASITSLHASTVTMFKIPLKRGGVIPGTDGGLVVTVRFKSPL